MTSSARADTTPKPNQDDRAAADARAAAFGRIIALLMASPRHGVMTLQQAHALVAPAIALGQIAILGRPSANTGSADMAAAALWAFVSPDVDARLTQSRDPFLALDASDWQSGDQPWIIEMVGNGEIINELVRRLADTTFAGKSAKLRAQLPDGRIAVGRVERKPHVTESPES